MHSPFGPPLTLRCCDPLLALGGPRAGREPAVEATTSLAWLDPNQAWGALSGPGAAARPVLSPEWGAIAEKPDFAHALAPRPYGTSQVRAGSVSVFRTDNPAPTMPVIPVLLGDARWRSLGGYGINGFLPNQLVYSPVLKYATMRFLHQDQVL